MREIIKWRNMEQGLSFSGVTELHFFKNASMTDHRGQRITSKALQVPVKVSIHNSIMREKDWAKNYISEESEGYKHC